MEAAARVLFRGADELAFNRAEFDVAGGPVLRLASLAAAARLDAAPADHDRIPAWLRGVLNDLSGQALLSSRFDFAQALDLWSLMWRGSELNGQLWRDSDLPEHTVAALRHCVEDHQPLAWWATAHDWVAVQRTELDRLVQRAKEIDRALASGLLDDALREVDSGLEAGEVRTDGLVSGDHEALVRRHARQRGIDGSGKRVHLMIPAVRAVARQIEVIAPLARWATPPPEQLAEVTELLSHLAETRPSLGAVFRAIAQPVSVADCQEELDALTVALLEAVDEENVRLTAARDLHAAGSRAHLVDQTLSTVVELEQRLADLEAGASALPNQAQDMLALARVALDEYDVTFGWECLANYHRYLEWEKFQADAAALRARAEELPEPERDSSLRVVRAAERSWPDWNSPDEPAKDARKLLADLERGALAGHGDAPALGDSGGPDAAVESSPLRETPAQRPAATPVSVAKRLFETGSPEAAVEAVWPDVRHCPDAPTRYFLFRVFRTTKDAGRAERLLANAETAGSARGFDYIAFGRVILEAGDHARAREALDKARALGADEASLRTVHSALAPPPSRPRLLGLTGSTTAEVLAWVDRVGVTNISADLARDIAETQFQENGPVAAVEVVLRLGSYVPGLAWRHFHQLTGRQIAALAPQTRAELAELLAHNTVEVIEHCATRFIDARRQQDAVTLLRAATDTQHKRDLLRVQRFLLRILDDDEAERLLAEQVFPRPGADLAPRPGVVADQPAPQPYGEGSLRPGSYVENAQRATEQGDPAAAALWAKTVREGRRWEALATALHYIIAAGQFAEALRLAAEVPVTSLPWIGVQWNIACAYARLGHNDTAAALFAKHAEWMDRPYRPADAAAVVQIFEAAGVPVPEEYLRVLASAEPPGQQQSSTGMQQLRSRFSTILYTSKRTDRTAPTVEAIHAHPAMADILAAADVFLDRYFLLVPERIERSWAGELEPATEAAIHRAVGLLAEGAAGDAAAELRQAWELQPTHEGIPPDLVGLFAAQRRYDEARTVADAGGERALRYDLLAAVAAAEQGGDRSLAHLATAQRMEPTEARAFAVAAMALRQGQRAVAMRALAEEAQRHVPGQLRATGAAAIVLADEDDQDTITAVLEHYQQFPPVQELVDWVIERDVPFDLIDLSRSLSEENLRRLAEGFVHRPRLLGVALHQRLQRLDQGRRTERATIYEFLITQALEEPAVSQAAAYFLQYEQEFGPEVTVTLRERAEAKHPPFRRALLEAKTKSRKLSREEQAELTVLRQSSKDLLPKAALRRFREAVAAVAALPVDILIEGTGDEIDAVFAALREVLPPTPEDNTADGLEQLWRSQLAEAKVVLSQGRTLSNREYTEARQRRAQIQRLSWAADVRLREPLRSLGQVFYEPWKAINRPRQAAPVTPFRPSGAADRALFAGRERQLDRIKSGFSRLADRGGWEIHHVHGPSGMGKSSLAKALTPRGDTTALLIPGVVPLWINCYTLSLGTPQPSLFAALAALVHDRYANILGRCPQLALPEVPPPDGVETGRDFVRWVDSSLPPGTAWLLLLDEFDHVARLPVAHEIVSEFRQARDEEGHAFGAVVLSRFSPQRLDQMLGGVQLETVEVPLDCLEAPATRTVLDRGMPAELRLSAEAHEYAYEMTRGFPLHVQHLGSALVAHAAGQARELDRATVATVVAQYRDDPDRVESELLPQTIRAQDYRRSMGATLELLGARLTTARMVPEAELLAGLDSDSRQQAREHLRLLSEAGLLVRRNESFTWLNPLIGEWAKGRYAPAKLFAAPLGTGLGEQVREAGFALVKQHNEKQVLRRDHRTFDAVAVPAEHVAAAESLLSKAFRGLPAAQSSQFQGVYDQQVVLLRPPVENSLADRVRTAAVEVDQAVEWIIEAADALVSVGRVAGFSHGWLSLHRLVDTGSRIWITGWAESAVAHLARRWPSKPEHGHVRRRPDGTANSQDDGFALAVMLARLLFVSASGPEGMLPCQTGDDGIADSTYLHLPKLNVVDDPDFNRYVRLEGLLRELLESPRSPRGVRDALLEWAERVAVEPASAVQTQIVLRLRPRGHTDWRTGEVPLEVTAALPGDVQRTYLTVIPDDAWRICSRSVQDSPGLQIGGELATMGWLLREGLFGKEGHGVAVVEDLGVSEQDAASLVTRLVIVAPAELHSLPWEMAALDPNKALADVVSVVRRLDEHTDEPRELHRPEQHLVLGRPGSAVPPGIAAEQVSRGWSEFCRHQGRETIFHFIGEGVPGALACGEGRFDLDILGDMLYSRNTVLTLLTACNSNAPDDGDGSTALRLFRSKIPAVVAMNGKVLTDTANEFAATLLERLGRTGDIELSLHYARQRMTRGYVWNIGLPVLYLSTADGKLFAPQPL